ncbi:uncharacterized protein L3040_008875 [Drepanopeziza brunnea f. sp. 'multigermtubi']|uniref:Uncharacterized protein n=1 Tax=Marssonina brunnea f. sp. multigermtubi (strain MB_m1) TaxID=1072389 RepID=K1WW32_MARBU|nr:uncharacterized protein MBM_04808 [Drepanopeziza brunnea f. sp. 'multigermtubi' MB_m1]EKD17231.1 hypothetical protein MBM_04808 [Drepanopeziza brunnea f. sp. 'multigermtubi' MB_m1]KAJ5032267.1 hypothetical protein L3040_008875 [Drepanopeziza brunnea f. sp. 'multigermtubi']
MAAPPSAPSLAGLAAERLWETQIRREHQVLLKQVRDIGAQRDTDLANLDRSREEITQLIIALQGRIDERERQINEQNCKIEEMETRHTEFEFYVRQLMGSWVSAERLEEIMATPAAIDYCSAATDLLGSPSQDEPRGSIEVAFENARTRPPPRVANRKRSKSVLQPVIEDSSARSPTKVQFFRKPAVPPARAVRSPSIVDSQKRPTTTRPTNGDPPRASPMTRSRSRSKSSERPRGPQSAKLPPKPTSVKIPKLSQGRRTFKAYYEQATAIFNDLGIKFQETELDFVSAFIKGIFTKKTATELTNMLEQSHMSKVTPDGTYVVICTWDELGEAVRDVGLDVKQPIVVKRRARDSLTPAAMLHMTKEVASFRAAISSPMDQSNSRGSRSSRRPVEDPGPGNGVSSTATTEVQQAEEAGFNRGKATRVSAAAQGGKKGGVRNDKR